MHCATVTRLHGCLLLLLCTTSVAHGWWETGHMIIAKIAELRLSPEAQQSSQYLLQVFHDEYPRHTNFTVAAALADYMKAKGLHTFDDWHYSHYLYHPNQSPNQFDVNSGDGNLVQALGDCLAALESKTADRWTSGFALMMLIHLVGEIHQPLHLISKTSHAMPKGDKGGTLQSIQITDALPLRDTPKTLNDLWESGAGLLDDLSASQDARSTVGGVGINLEDVRLSAVMLAAQWQDKDSFKGAELFDTDFGHWAEEGFGRAVDVVYGELDDHAWLTTAGVVHLNGTHAQAYLVRAQSQISMLLVLAGYRLAAILNHIFLDGVPFVHTPPSAGRPHAHAPDAPPASSASCGWGGGATAKWLLAIVVLETLAVAAGGYWWFGELRRMGYFRAGNKSAQARGSRMFALAAMEDDMQDDFFE